MIQAKAAVPRIRAVLEESTRQPDLQKNAAIALGLIGDRDAVQLLAEVLERASTEYVQSAVSLALGFIGDRSSVALLQGRIEGGKMSGLARAHAVVALGVVAERRALPALHVVAVDSNYHSLVEALEEILTIT